MLQVVVNVTVFELDQRLCSLLNTGRIVRELRFLFEVAFCIPPEGRTSYGVDRLRGSDRPKNMYRMNDKAT